jgi:hypothetical protein
MQESSTTYRIANMQHQVWLYGNRRPYWVALVVSEMVCVAGVLMLVFLHTFPMQCIAIGLLALSGLASALTVIKLAKPRLAYCDGVLRLYLRKGGPIEIPIEIVEGFLIGQSPAHLPGAESTPPDARNVVIRLAERATEWERCEVDANLAKWCGGYVTIYGMWCEPLSIATANRLNELLHLAHQSSPAKSQE